MHLVEDDKPVFQPLKRLLDGCQLGAVAVAFKIEIGGLDLLGDGERQCRLPHLARPDQDHCRGAVQQALQSQCGGGERSSLHLWNVAPDLQAYANVIVGPGWQE